MKIVNAIKVLVILSSVMLLTSCADKSKLLIKTWMVENLKYTTEVPVEMQEQIDRTIEEMRKSFRLIYNADGTYTTQNNEEVLKGTWKLNWNSSQITSISSNGDKKEYKILELTESKLVFKTSYVTSQIENYTDSNGASKTREVKKENVVTFEMIPAK